MLVLGRLSLRMVWPKVNNAGAVPAAPLAAVTVQVQLGLASGVVAGTPSEFALVAVRSGHTVVIGVVTVGAGLVSTVAFALLALQVASCVNVAVAWPLL